MPRDRNESWEVMGVNEMLTTPAGTYKTLHVRRVGTDQNATSDKQYWFACGVGKVRESGAGGRSGRADQDRRAVSTASISAWMWPLLATTPPSSGSKRLAVEVGQRPARAQQHRRPAHRVPRRQVALPGAVQPAAGHEAQIQRRRAQPPQALGHLVVREERRRVRRPRRAGGGKAGHQQRPIQQPPSPTGRWAARCGWPRGRARPRTSSPTAGACTTPSAGTAGQLQADRDAEQRQPVAEVHRAVQRIDVPGAAAGRPRWRRPGARPPPRRRWRPRGTPGAGATTISASDRRSYSVTRSRSAVLNSTVGPSLPALQQDLPRLAGDLLGDLQLVGP